VQSIAAGIETMRRTTVTCLLIGLCMLGGPAESAVAADAGQVEVVLPGPDALRDAAPGADRAALLADLGRDLERSARSRAPAGGTLRITLVGVDLAGRFEPWHGPQLANVRIIRNVYSPSIDLEFELADAGGQVVKAGRRVLRDPSGALLGTPDLPADPLRFEKLLLREWLDREFAPAR
jgi:hypothetical protein